MPSTKVKVTIAQVLKDEGFVLDYQVGKIVKTEDGRTTFQTETGDKDKKILRIFLKYGPDGERVIRRIQRASKPGRRYYCGYKDLKPILQGMGISVVSTSRGVMSDRKARAERLGGELLCYVW